MAGAHRAIVGEDLHSEFSPYDLILDSIGGTLLGNALGVLAKRGTCVTYGASADANVTFDARQFYGTGGATLYGFILFDELGQDPASVGLKRLVQLMTAGRLRSHIDLTQSWTEIAAVAQQLSDRQFIGKAVLQVD